MKSIFTRTWILLTCGLAICAYALAITLTRPETVKADPPNPLMFHLFGQVQNTDPTPDAPLSNFTFWITVKYYNSSNVYTTAHLYNQSTDSNGYFRDGSDLYITFTLPSLYPSTWPEIYVNSCEHIAPYEWCESDGTTDGYIHTPNNQYVSWTTSQNLNGWWGGTTEQFFVKGAGCSP